MSLIVPKIVTTILTRIEWSKRKKGRITIYSSMKSKPNISFLFSALLLNISFSADS